MTLGVLESLEEIQIKATIARDGDLAAYSKVVHDWEQEEYQEAWNLALETEPKTLIICPPDTYKSSTVQCFVEKTIGENPNIRILWLMNAGEQTQKRVMAIQETIEQNNVYRAAFNVEPNYDAGWTKTAFFVKRSRSSPDPTLMGCGFNGPYQGLHFDIIIIDDPTNQEDVASPTTMERQRLKLRGVILDRLVEGGRIVGIMTRWGEDDLLPTFKEIGFRIVTMPVEGNYPWGPTISNRRFPLDRCAQIRREKTDAIYDLTYMCNPSSVDGGIIKREYLQYWDTPGSMVLPTSGTLTIMAVDPATGVGPNSDFSVIGTGLVEIQSRRLFITELWGGRLPVHELTAQITRRARMLSNLAWVAVETKGFQMTYMQTLKRETRLPLRELPYRTKKQSVAKAVGLDNNKTGRAIEIAQRSHKGDILYGSDPRMFPKLDGVTWESELCAYPYGAHDDRLDVVAFLRAMADAYRPTGLKVKLGR